jgi:hypothetical protein
VQLDFTILGSGLAPDPCCLLLDAAQTLPGFSLSVCTPALNPPHPLTTSAAFLDADKTAEVWETTTGPLGDAFAFSPYTLTFNGREEKDFCCRLSRSNDDDDDRFVSKDDDEQNFLHSHK